MVDDDNIRQRFNKILFGSDLTGLIQVHDISRENLHKGSLVEPFVVQQAYSVIFSAL